MTPTPTRDTREEIKRAFAHQLLEAGYKGASLDAVAQSVGIRKPSIYHHFPGGKETLYVAVARDHIDRASARLDDALAGDGLEQRLVRIVLAVADPTGATTSFDQRVFDALGSVSPETREELSTLYVGALLTPVERLFADAVAAGDLGQVDPGLLTNAFLHLARAVDMLSGDREEVARSLVGVFLRGALPR